MYLRLITQWLNQTEKHSLCTTDSMQTPNLKVDKHLVAVNIEKFRSYCQKFRPKLKDLFRIWIKASSQDFSYFLVWFSKSTGLKHQIFEFLKYGDKNMNILKFSEIGQKWSWRCRWQLFQTNQSLKVNGSISGGTAR